MQDIFNLLPDLDKAETAKSFSVAQNDQLLVVYLSSLIRSVIALHGLINNRAENAREEEEESGGAGKKESGEAGSAAADNEKEKKEGSDAKNDEKKP